MTALACTSLSYASACNGARPTTKIKFAVPATVGNGHARSLHVMLKIYDITGREVATLVNDYKPSGYYEVEFDGSNLASGTYIYRIEAGNFVQAKKMILMK